jgi:hypothetical protein
MRALTNAPFIPTSARRQSEPLASSRRRQYLPERYSAQSPCHGGDRGHRAFTSPMWHRQVGLPITSAEQRELKSCRLATKLPAKAGKASYSAVRMAP